MNKKRSEIRSITVVLSALMVVLVPSLLAGQDRPNIVLIVVDDLRFDEFGAGGHPYLETPHIDRLAAEGAVFHSAYHATPLCSPNRASILTGQYVSRHGILDVAGVKIPKHVQGTSLTPLLRGQRDEVHEAILIEFYSHENPFPWTASLDYRVVRKCKYKYIRWIRFDEDQAELYDLDKDPYELNNLAKDPNMAGVIKDLKKDMRRLVLMSLGLGD